MPFADTILQRLKRIKARAFEDRSRARERASTLFKFKYACFKDLLASNTELLNIITDLEAKLRGQEVFGMSYVRSQATRAVFHTLKMVKSLDDLSGRHFAAFFPIIDNLNSCIKAELGQRKELTVTEWVLPYSGITREMADWVGGKNANLGELLNRVGLPIPEGFAITTAAYHYFLEQNDLVDEINRLRRHLDLHDPHAITNVSREMQDLIRTAPAPVDLELTILSSFDRMAERIRETSDETRREIRTALRSSAIGEDSELSYAGQYTSVLNVRREKLIDTYKEVLASLYTPRAVSYRLAKGMRDEDIAMSVACIEMVNSIASGVMYSRDPSNPLADEILIEAVWGLGSYAVDGIVTPDNYMVSKDGKATVVIERISRKPVQLVGLPEGGLKEIPVKLEKQDAACLSPEQIQKLAEYGLLLEKHYEYPQDTEWALDDHGRLMILQTRPLHLENRQAATSKEFPRADGYSLLVEGGAVVFPGIGFGPAVHVKSEEDLETFPAGGILVARHAEPQFVMVMTKAQAIVTDTGSVTSHMASLAREFGVPTILDTKTATVSIPPGVEVTVDAYSARVYEGLAPELLNLRRTRDSIMKDTPVFRALRKVADRIVPLNLTNPAAANFAPQHCKTLHDIMRLVHELSYKEMFAISDLVSDHQGPSAFRLVAPIPLDLRIIDVGGGLTGASSFSKRVTVDQIASVPFRALLDGMLHEDLRNQGPRPIHLGGFLSVVREQMFTPPGTAERFGDRSYAIVSDYYLNFSSRIGYHYSVLDTYCCETASKNYITFSFKGGAADEIRRNRRARAIAAIFDALGFMVEVREDRVAARYYKHESELTREKLDMVGRMLQFTRQMDMLMQCEGSVEALAKTFLEGNYALDHGAWSQLLGSGASTHKT
ncbi:MAG: phosphoenolpyruvate synthase [Deltaproteobacteria bacterium]|nr:phosphoenolpyruvate synthase [Deltaproteobacteria bacterium]